MTVCWPRWRHRMEIFSALLALCAGNSLVTGKLPAQRRVTRSVWCFYLICAWINGWVNSREAGDLRRHRAHYDVTVMWVIIIVRKRTHQYPRYHQVVHIPSSNHYDVIKWKHFPRYWPFVRAIHRSPVNSPHKGQWRGALILSLICVWINSWVNNRKAGDLRRYRVHYDVSVMTNIFFNGFISVNMLLYYLINVTLD